MGDMISYTRPDGQTSKAYLAEPAQGSNAPGIVVIQEWWGLNDQIRSVAEDYAA
jgi:carboxymethylenebutenolidase